MMFWVFWVFFEIFENFTIPICDEEREDLEEDDLYDRKNDFEK